MVSVSTIRSAKQHRAAANDSRRSPHSKPTSLLRTWKRLLLLVFVIVTALLLKIRKSIPVALPSNTTGSGKVGGETRQGNEPELVMPNKHKGSTGTLLPRRKPTHTACRDDNVKGIYHIAMGDIGGAVGTIFYQFVIAQILYAEQHGLKPWIHLSNVSHVVYDTPIHNPLGHSGVQLTALVGRNATYMKRPGGHFRDYTPGPANASVPVRSETLHFDGTGVWEHYFAPVSDFVPGDSSCENKLYVTMDLKLVTPGLHGYAEYAPRCWRYQYLPDYISRPHVGLTEWLEPYRRMAHRVVTQYHIRPIASIQEAAQMVNPNCSLSSPCLGLHIRHSDKASGRQIIDTSQFLPYALAFLRAASAAAAKARIYVATDSSLVLDEIAASWPRHVQAAIRTADTDNVVQLRSSNAVAVFDLDGARHHHRANQEVLTEIVALSACQFLVHGLSAVSEAAIWTAGMDLHYQSVNLEDVDHVNETQFERLVQLVLAGTTSSQTDLPRPVRSEDIWPDLYAHQNNERPSLPTGTGEACRGFDGVLLISSTGGDGKSSSVGASAAFFTAVLNQLAFAEAYNLKPWVHLSSSEVSNANIYDDRVHNSTMKHGGVEFEMRSGVSIRMTRLNGTMGTKSTLYPDGLEAGDASKLSSHSFSVQGNGIWNSYFDPVSDFVPGDESCRHLPLIQLAPLHVTSLTSLAPTSVRAWRYDSVPDSTWWHGNMGVSLTEWYGPMRAVASSLVQKYYRIRPYIVKRAQQINPAANDQTCLGLHLRNGDKLGRHRTKVKPQEFEPYVEAFVQAGGRCIFVATDSHRTLRFIRKNWAQHLTQYVQSQGDKVVRSTKLDWPAHYLERHHRVNAEVVVDIVALSQCRLLVHGFSTVSEAAIYLNPSLHSQSVNMEDPGRLSVEDFALLVQQDLSSST